MKATSFNIHDDDKKNILLRAKHDVEFGDESMEAGETRKVTKGEAKRIMNQSGGEFDLELE